MANDAPVIIEVAINGETGKDRNPNSPRSPEEITAVAIECIEAGATVIHNHIEKFTITGKEAADRYKQGWADIRRHFPQAVLCPTAVMHPDLMTRLEHFEHLADVADMAVLDPGTTSFAFGEEDGLPSQGYDYVNSYAEIRVAFDQMNRLGLGASMALYDASYVRAVLAWHRAGKLPPGSLPKFYFGGEWTFQSGERGVSFGLLPTAKALNAYVEMIEGTGLPWATAVLGGCAIRTGMARFTLERGGHLRIGLEDYAGDDRPTNLELVKAAVDLCREVGRPVATMEETRAILGLKSLVPAE
jgi:3-keto-5-aminohexanoate cleavage enzyme